MTSNLRTERQRRAVGVFPSRHAAERALHALRDSGFPMDRVSVITREADRHDDIAGADVRDSVGNKADEGATAGAISGGALGGLTGLLVGLGTLAIPGVGPIMLAGATATALATTLAGGAIGAVTGGLIGALIGLGIPEERARVYHDRVARGQYLVIVDGTNADIARAETILHRGGIEEYGVYDAPATAATPVATAPVVGAAHTPTSHAVVTEPAGTDLSRRYQAVGFFPRLEDAEHAVTDLRSTGFPLGQISLAARRFPRRQYFTGVDLRDRLEAMRYGIPVETARQYEDRLDRGHYLVMVNGSEDEIRRAASVLSRRHIQDWHVYDPTRVNNDRDAVSSSSASMPPLSGEPAHTAVRPTTGLAGEPAHTVTPGHGYSEPTHAASGPIAGQHRRAVGVFAHRRDAEAALTELRDAGFPMDRISLIGKHSDHDAPIAGVQTQSAKGNKADEGAKAGAATGGILGGLGGLLVGLGTLAIPGVGPVILGGAAATALATTVTGGAIGAAAGGLAGGLVGLGIPENRAKVYNDRVARGDYLVMIDGSQADVERAEGILRRHRIEEWGVYDAREVETNRSQTRSDRATAPDVDTSRSTIDPVTGSSPPIVTIMDKRDETRR